MSRVREIRQACFELLFQLDAAEPPLENTETLDPVAEHQLGPNELIRAREMATGAWSFRAEADRLLSILAPKWPALRMPVPDRCALRLGIWELAETDTPSKVIINEAIELAKLYGTEQSPPFVNGVLDAALAQLRKQSDQPATSSTPADQIIEEGS